MPLLRRNGLIHIAAILVAAVMALQGVVLMPGSVYGTEQTAVDSPNYADNQLLVMFDKDVTKDTAADIVAFALSEELAGEGRSVSAGSLKTGLKLSKVKSEDNIMLVETGVSLDEEAATGEIAKNPDVKYAQPNYYYSTLDAVKTKDTYSADQWYLDYIDAPEAWDLIDEQRNKGKIKNSRTKIIVASLDTGVARDQRDLVRNTEQAAGAGSGIDPQNSHGTKVAGVIAATSNNKRGIAGVAAGNNNDIIRLMSLDVFHDEKNDTKKSAATTADIISGIDYACRHEARIITMCFGRHGQDKALEDKLNWASKEGTLLIASAGNNGDDQPWYPSDYASCISCINTTKYTDAFSEDCRNETSSYGSKKDISAPGTSILTTSMGDVVISDTGTSFSTSIVAGTAAMVMYANQSLSVKKVKNILFTTAEDLLQPGKDGSTGYGNVNAYRAVAKALGTKATDEDRNIPKTTVKASAGKDGSIILDWKQIKNAEVCVISRKGPSGETFTQMDVVPSETTTWTDSDCKPGEEYTYKIAGGLTTKDGKKILGESSEPAVCKAKGKI
ncbi:MAG: S8 family serine peptidase [Bacillota bacterium]|nr:S8 family serine peptidase [Bacillota bacterium]